MQNRTLFVNFSSNVHLLTSRSMSGTKMVFEAKPFKSIPGPSVAQLILRRLPGGKYDGLEWSALQQSMIDEYGPIVAIPQMLSNAGRTMITDPNDFELAFRHEGPYPNRRLFLTNYHYRTEVAPEKFNHNAGLLAQGEAWGRLRSVVNPILLKPSTINQYIPKSDAIAMEFVKRCKAIRDEKNEVPSDFVNEIKKWAMETVSCIAFDTRMNVINHDIRDPTNRASTFIRNIEEFSKLSYALEMQASLWKFIATPKYKETMKVLETVSDIAISFVKEAEKNYEKHPSAAIGREPSVLEKMLKIDRDYAVVMGIDMIIAGIDTTTSGAFGLIYNIAKNPEKQEILRKELLNVPVNEYGGLTPKSFKNVPYFKACFKESLRMSPVAAGNARHVAQDIEIKGYEIPAGTDLTMAVTLLLRDGQHFGYPNAYIPERWLDEKFPTACPEYKPTHPFVFLPFGFGPRACIGKRIAMMEMQTLMTRLLQNFRLEYNYAEPKSRVAITLSPIGEFKLKLTDLNTQSRKSIQTE